MTPTNSRFFGGDPSHGLFRHVAPIPATSFKDFFESQIWVPVRLKVTRSEFDRLPEDEAKAIKFVPYFTPAAFAEPDDTGRFPKKDTNVKSISLVCLDIDPEKEKDENGKWVETGVYPAAALVNETTIIWEGLREFNFAVYTTLNHRPDAARVRVVVEADDLPPELYTQAVSFVAERLCLPYVTTESKVKSQAMFRPTVFADSDEQIDHPVIAKNLKGRAIAAADLSGQDIAPTAGTRRKPQAHTGDSLLDGLEFLQPRVDAVTLKDAEEALNHVDPCCSMDEWIKMGMALAHQFPDNLEEAFEIWNTWSKKGGDVYPGLKTAEYRWNSWKSNPTDRNPVTIKTLFKLAKDSGWSNPELGDRIFKDLKAWLESRTNHEELVDRGIERIIAAPMSQVYEQALLKIIQVKAKKMGVDSGLPYYTKQLKAKKAEISEFERKKKEHEKGTPNWAKGLIYISELEVFQRFGTGEKVTRSSFDSTYGVHLLPTDKELEQMGSLSRSAKLTPIVRPQDYVLNELEIPRVHNEAYDPANPQDHITVKGGVRFVNTYRQSYHPPKKDKAERQGKVFLDHVGLLIREPEYQRRLVDFIAFMVQNPGRKIRWAFLIQSAQGNGKGLLAKCLRGIFGRGNIKTVDPEAIFSPFNDWACGTQLTVMNEIRVTGHSRHDVMNKLKEPIADDQVSINQKFRDNREVDNVTNYLMFTNHRDALALEERERRYFVVFSQLQTDKDIDRLHKSGALKPLQDLVDANSFGGLRSFFEDWTISPTFCPDSPPPKTVYFREMANLTKADGDILLDDLLKDGTNPWIQPDILSASAVLSAINAELPKATSGRVVNSMLTTAGFESCGRMTVCGERHQVWVEAGSFLKDLNLAEILEDRVRRAKAGADDIF